MTIFAPKVVIDLYLDQPAAPSVVVCDYCGDDHTTDSAPGGLLFGTYAACPKCAPQMDRSARTYGETRFIRARCPEGKTFAQWVREDLRKEGTDHGSR